MRKMAALLAGGMVSAALVSGPAQASGSDDQEQLNTCGEGYVLAGNTKITGPEGRESLGKIVQTTNLTTHDGCSFVVLKHDKGTAGTLTVTVDEAGADTADGTWDVSTVTAAPIDLAEGFVSEPVHHAYADVERARVTADFVGAAYQGKQHSEKRTKTVPASPAAKRAAKKAYQEQLKAAKKALKKSGSKKKYHRAVDKAKDRLEDVLDGHRERVTVVVADKTPFTTSASTTFALADAVQVFDDDETEVENESD
jgi:hypothetical protein